MCLRLSKSLSEFHLHIIRTGRSEVATTRLYIADGLNPWVGSQSHKRGCLCSTNSDRRVYGFRAACGHMSKYYKR